MKRILVITHAGGSPTHGPNMRWYYLGKALAPLGVQVEIVSSSSFHKYISAPRISVALAEENVGGLAYHWIRTSPYKARGVAQVRNQIEFVLGCYRHAGAIAERKPDIVIASSPHPLVNLPAAAIARRAGARFMVEVRDLWPAILLELGKFGPRHPYILALKAAEHYGVKRAEKVLSVKPGDLEYFQSEYDMSADRFLYAPNGFLPGALEEGAIPSSVKDLRHKYDYLMGYVGAISTYYGLEHLVELAKRFRGRRDIGFVVVGKGDREKELASRAGEAGLDNFHLVGAIDKSNVSATIDQFDVCYVGLQDLGIHRYGISCNKIYEYMHAGKPILGSYTAGYDPVSAAGCGITARPGDYESLVSGLEALLESESMRRGFGLEGQKYFAENHDFHVVAKKLYHELFHPQHVN